MNDHTETELETRLRELTKWDNAPTGAWKQALSRTENATTPARSRRPAISFTGPAKIAAGIFVALGGIVILAMIGGNLPQAHFGVAAPTSSPMVESEMLPTRSNFAAGQPRGADESAKMPDADAAQETAPPPPPTSQSPNQPDAKADIKRAVIRRATIDIKTTDVRTVFLKARLVVSEAGGEYIENSSLTGAEPNIYASMTLRVRTTRLSDVLNELRELGVVVSESASGEDVTAQVVDVDARLRNEERVEKELLELLDTRKDSPLKEVLELRTQINEIRQGIERLTAQRDQLSRLTSLATVLVIVRSDQNAADQHAANDRSMWTYFKDQIRRSYRTGLMFLANTVAGAAAVLIGGAFWWILIAVSVLIGRAMWKRRHAV